MFFDILSFILIGIGLRVLLTASGVLPERIDFLRDRVNNFVFYYILPFICFKTSYTMPFNFSHLKVSLVANLTIMCSVVFSWFIYRKVAKIKKIKPEVIGSLVMCSAFGNVLFLGLPILTKLYGEQGMSYAFTYDFLASTPLTWTVAVAVCMKYGKAKTLKLKSSILTILKIPPIWGLVTGLIFREIAIPLPEYFIEFLKDVSKYITYLMLMIVGLAIKAVPTKKFMILFPAILIKLIVSPLLAFLFGNTAGLSGVPLNVCIIDAAMPSMILSMIFATAFGTDLRTAVEMIFLTTVIFLLLFSVFSTLF